MLLCHLYLKRGAAMMAFIGFLICGIIAVGIFLIWILSIVSCLRNAALSDMNRLIYIVLIIFLGVIGSLIYYAVAPKRISVSRIKDVEWQR